jgi:DNA-binding NtrC family response regulator
MGISCPDFDDKAYTALMDYDFPGNVRELRNIVERALIESRGETILARHIHRHAAHPYDGRSQSNPLDEPSADTDTIPLNLKEAEATIIQRALAASSGNIAEAARLMGISRQKLYRMMASHSMN